ncbi:hypothetical protein THRCLA_02531 [Thraustotheca clavata]|uniref:Uncharacterized protein n=1 Tax=Thraustotheca clavata TaxID=74557 RepID=A0A1W0A550_9STRA|nr:hypothetical protein THRCLA_02531 [Thraustotheca clavata]
MTSPLDIAASIAFFTTSYTSLCTSNFGIRVPEGHDLLHSKSLSPTKSSFIRRIQFIFWCVVISTSLLLVGIAVVFLMGDSCSAACPLYTYPWFIVKCSCVMYILDCNYHPIIDIDLYIQSTLTDVFYLSIVHCALPYGLTKETMANLTHIYALSIDKAGIIQWDIHHSDMPSSLFAIYMPNMRMPQWPTVLSKAWPSLEYVSLEFIIH